MEFNSIEDFKKNFAQIYRSKVYPTLSNIDVERQNARKEGLKKAFFIGFFALVSFIIGSIYKEAGEFFFFISLILVITAFTYYSFTQKSFEQKLKTRIMPVLMDAFGNFHWTQTERISTSEIRDSRIFSRFDHRDIDDNFYGFYQDMPIEISESHLYYYTRDSKGRRQLHTTFKGVLISIGVGKRFSGHTIVRQRGFLLNSKVYQEVKLEDPEFQKRYFVDSNDQVEARFILTTAFMDRFKNLSNAFGAEYPECSFKDGKLLIALSTRKDLFKLGNLNTPVTEAGPYQQFLNEIISILEMIAVLKVTQKTGL